MMTLIVLHVSQHFLISYCMCRNLPVYRLLTSTKSTVQFTAVSPHYIISYGYDTKMRIYLRLLFISLLNLLQFSGVKTDYTQYGELIISGTFRGTLIECVYVSVKLNKYLM